MASRPPARYGYRSLGAEPGFGVRLAGAAASKLQAGMFSFALLYAVSAGRSYGVAALVVAVAALGGIAAPLRGRLLDRFGDRRVLWPILAVHVVSVAALSVNEGLHGPVLATFGPALVANVSMPPVGVLSRVMWRRMSQPENLRSALALDAVLTDLAFVLGPALVGLLTEAVSPMAGLAVSSGSSALAAVLLLRAQAGREPARRVSRDPVGGSRREPLGGARRESVAGTLREPAAGDAGQESERGTGGARHWFGPLVLAPLRWLLLVACLFAAALHAVQIALPAVAGRSAGAALVSLLSVGSIVGGLAVGALRGRWVPRLPALLLGLALACVALAVVGRLPLGLLVAGCLLVGLFIGPTFVSLYSSAGDLAPSGTEVETQSWTGAAIQLGAAVGAAAGAAAIEGWAPLAAVGVAAVLALSGVGAGVRVARSPRHRSRPDGPSRSAPTAESAEAGRPSSAEAGDLPPAEAGRLSTATNNLDVPPGVDPDGRGVSARIEG